MKGTNENGPIIPGEKNELDQCVTFRNFKLPLIFGRSRSIELVVNRLLSISIMYFLEFALNDSKGNLIYSDVEFLPSKIWIKACLFPFHP